MLRYNNIHTLSRTFLNTSRRHWNNAWIAQKKNLSTDATKTNAAVKETIAKEATNTVKASTTTGASTSSGGIMSLPKDHPFLFQLGVATAKTSAADLLCQVVAEKKKWNEIDWKRNGIFVVFGFVYLGGFQYWIMVNKYRQWFPTMDRFAKLTFAQKLKDTAGLIDAAKMVLFDVTVHLPLMYFPSYYALKEFVSGHTWNPVDWVRDGTAKYAKNVKEDLSAMIKLWGPADCVQFVLPLHIRMPFRHLVSFFWTAYVSFTRGAIAEDKEVEKILETE